MCGRTSAMGATRWLWSKRKRPESWVPAVNPSLKLQHLLLHPSRQSRGRPRLSGQRKRNHRPRCGPVARRAFCRRKNRQPAPARWPQRALKISRAQPKSKWFASNPFARRSPRLKRSLQPQRRVKSPSQSHLLLHQRRHRLPRHRPQRLQPRSQRRPRRRRQPHVRPTATTPAVRRAKVRAHRARIAIAAVPVLPGQATAHARPTRHSCRAPRAARKKSFCRA